MTDKNLSLSVLWNTLSGAARGGALGTGIAIVTHGINWGVIGNYGAVGGLLLGLYVFANTSRDVSDLYEEAFLDVHEEGSLGVNNEDDAQKPSSQSPKNPDGPQ